MICHSFRSFPAKYLLSLTLSALTLMPSRVAQAQAPIKTAVPLALTGLNNHVFYGNGTTTGNTLPDATFDEEENSPFVLGAPGISGVPQNDGQVLGQYTQTTATNYLAGDNAPYFILNHNSSISSGNDSAQLAPNGTLTLTLNNPQRENHIYIFMSTANAFVNDGINITFNYAGGNHIANTASAYDWDDAYAPSSAVYGTALFDRVIVSSATTATYDTTGKIYDFYMFAFASGDTTDKLNSITFTGSSAFNGDSLARLNIFDISATAATPAPASLPVMLLGFGPLARTVLRRRAAQHNAASFSRDA
jgi:hypothetical protein